jgi:hypothetical protein
MPLASSPLPLDDEAVSPLPDDEVPPLKFEPELEPELEPVCMFDELASPDVSDVLVPLPHPPEAPTAATPPRATRNANRRRASCGLRNVVLLKVGPPDPSGRVYVYF